MHSNFYNAPSHGQIQVTEEVLEYINKRKCDFRICTSCGGPILLPISMKSPKPNDFQVRAGDYMIFIQRPISAVFLVIALVMILLGLKPLIWKKKDWRERLTEAEKSS